MRKIILVAVLAAAASLAAAGQAPAKTTWLCRPGQADDPCTPSLSTTLYSGFDKRIGVIRPQRVARPKVDCFYVYPTVSNQQTDNATLAKDPEIRSIALFQASRYSQDCRVFAPVYRQVTVSALQRQVPASAAKTAYGDVAAAWKEYLARYNKGRGVVLIGHSQGTFQLTTLIKREIDTNPAVRRRLVSAILLGGNVTVKRGSDTGGSFRHVATCRSATQLGCVIAFSTFDATPPANAVFGRAIRPGYEVVCTNPAALGSSRSARLDSIAPSAPFAPGTLIAAGIQALQFTYPSAKTTYVETRGAFSGRCSSAGGAHVLRVTSLGSTPVPKPSPDPSWGLHLMDGNLALGDLVRVVRTEIAAYTARG